MTVLHVGPHLDDETTGCGGSLLAHIQAGDTVHWLVGTGTATAHGPDNFGDRNGARVSVRG